MANEREIVFDIDGYDVITDALMALVNEYPGLLEGERFTFATLDENRGKAMFPQGGAVILEEQADILGRVRQTCQYPFYIIYRAGGLNSDRKRNVKEWLDDLGRWLEGQEISVQGTEYRLEEYPELTSGRRFRTIQRTSVAALNNINNNNTEDWAIAITARYINEFKRL